MRHNRIEPGPRIAARVLQLFGLALLCLSVCCSKRDRPQVASAPQPPPIDPLQQALAKVEEDRGEPSGRNVLLEVPAELRHYADRRRFLAVQTAEERQQQYTLPHDYADLATMIRAGQLVEMPVLGDDYVLFGVGENATSDPFMHYDGSAAGNVTLCSNDDEFAAERSRLEGISTDTTVAIASLQSRLRALGKRDRAGRRVINSQIAATRKHLARVKAQEKLLESYAERVDSRHQLMFEAHAIAELARNFEGQTYDLSIPDSRRQLKIRMLSFIRPEAREMMLGIAREYREKFNRPLPVTSLIRTQQYQKELSEWNRNAARNETPPHVTGLAFDIYYRYMSASEQEYLMSIISHLKDAGRVEALRETRDHIHVFAFAGGARPNEELISASITRRRKS